MADFPKRGEIWLVVLPDEELERPCIVVSLNNRNQYANSILIVPLTSNPTQSNTHVRINLGEGGISRESMARCENITNIPKDYFGEAPLGRTIPKERMNEIEKAIQRAVGIPVSYRDNI